MRNSVKLIISAIVALIAISSANAQTSTTTKNVTNETNITNTNTVQTEVVPQYDINYVTVVFENAWVDENGVKQPVFIKSLAGRRSGKSTLKSLATPILEGSTAPVDVKKIDTLLTTDGTPGSYITFAVAVGKDDKKLYKTIKILYPGVNKTIGIVLDDAAGKLFIDKNQANNIYVKAENNNFTKGEGKTTYFSLLNTSTLHMTIDNPGINAYVIPVGETVQLSEKDITAISKAKDGIHVLCMNPANLDMPPVRKTIYLPVPSNAGVITITDKSFQDKARQGNNGSDVVRYVLYNSSELAVTVIGILTKAEGDKDGQNFVPNGIVTINAHDSKAILVRYGASHITITSSDENGEEINQVLMISADYKSRGKLIYSGSAVNGLVPNGSALTGSIPKFKIQPR